MSQNSVTSIWSGSVSSLAVICSSRRPVRRPMSTNFGPCGGASRALTSWSGVMFLRRTNVPCWSDPVRPRSTEMNTNARLSASRPGRLELGGDGPGRVALLDQELDLGRLLRDRRGQRRAELLGHDVLDERQLEGRRIVVGDAHDRVGDGGPQRGQRDRQDDHREDEGEDQELEQPDDAAAGTPAAATARGHGLGELGDRFGGVGVRIVGTGLRSAAVPGASAGADRHRLISWGSGRRGMDERTSGSCVELVLEDDRRRLAIDPRAIGVALGLARRSARPAAFHRPEAGLGEVAAQPLVAECDREPECTLHRVRPRSGEGRLRSLVARGLERQPDDQLVDVVPIDHDARAPAHRRRDRDRA